MSANRIEIDPIYCKGCGLCTIACPLKLIEMSDTLNEQGYLPAVISPANLARCTACALCARMCPDAAIRVYKAAKPDGGQS